DRKLALVGIDGKRTSESDVARVLAERRTRWKAPPQKHRTGILSLFARVASSASEGAMLTAPVDGHRAEATDGGGAVTTPDGSSIKASSPGARVVIADYDF